MHPISLGFFGRSKRAARGNFENVIDRFPQKAKRPASLPRKRKLQLLPAWHAAKAKAGAFADKAERLIEKICPVEIS